MALAQELLNLLNNDEEPLPKRLKIADNAFTACNLPMQHREAVLLEWLTKLTKSNEQEVWSLLLKWLQSVQVHNLSRSDVNYGDLKSLNTLLCKRLKHEESIVVATDCILEIIKNRNFQIYFKHNLEEHCRFVGKILLRLKGTDQLHKFLISDQLLNRTIAYGDDFHRNFIKYTLTPLCVSVGGMGNEHQSFIGASKLLDKCIFTRNFNAFSTFLSQGEKELPKLLFDHLRNVRNTDDALHVYNLTFHSFCKSYNNVNVICSCFTLLVETLGLDADFTEKSIEIVARMCAVLRDCGVQVNTKLDHGDLFDRIVKRVIGNLKPCKASYEFLNKVIVLDPVLMQKNLAEILRYVLSNANDEVAEEQATFLLSLFEVFAKLHRMSNLLTAMMDVSKSSTESRTEIPDAVLNFFSQCVVTLPSWQTLDLFKILLANLNEAVGRLEEEGNFSYLQLIGTFLCQFLSSVRVAEHVVPTNVVESFEKLMIELRGILKQFGTTLVGVEHKPNLMRVYLDICFKWGELYMVLAYYTNDVKLATHVNKDPSACNITYLHSYLHRAQWRLIFQRIANFGEKPCKKIMHSLCVQKLRAMNLFEEDVSEEVTAAVAANLASLNDEQDLLFDNFCLRNIVVPTSGVEIANVLVKSVVKTGDFKMLQKIDDNIFLIREILHVCFLKLNKSFAKEKRSDCVTSRMLMHFDKGIFDIPSMVKELSQTGQATSVHDAKVSQYLAVIQSMALPKFDDKNINEAVLVYLVGLSLDLKSSSLRDANVARQLENIVIGIFQNSALLNIFLERNAILAMVNNFEIYEEVFTIVMEGALKNKSKLECFKDIIGDFTENIGNVRYRNCAVVFLKYVDKVKTKVALAEKQVHNLYREQICSRLLPFLLNDSTSEDSLEAYALTLKFYLNNNSKRELEDLLPLSKKYLDVLMSSFKCIKGSILLLTVVLHKKAMFESVIEDVVLKVWECCHHLLVDGSDHERYNKLVQSTLQMISDDTFAQASSRLTSVCEKAIAEGRPIGNEMKMWKAISSCDLNAAQTKIWQHALESLIHRILLTNGGYYEDAVTLQMSFIQNSHFTLSPPLIEAVLITISKLNSNCTDVVGALNSSISLLEALIKHRKTLMTDYLPPYLQRYRTVLSQLCRRSDSNSKLDTESVRQLANCAHRFERLTKALQICQKSMTRISPYVIADVLSQFEKVTLYPNVKIHLSNSVYQLLAMCDEHGIAFLKRVLSTASTEMFKIICDNYNKYYKFMGKV